VKILTTHKLDSPLPSTITFQLADECRIAYDHISSLFPPATQEGYNAWKKARLNRIVRQVDACSKDEEDAKIIIGDLMPYMTEATWFERSAFDYSCA